MINFFPADQESAAVLQMFRDHCNRYNGDSGPQSYREDTAEWLFETCFMQISCFQAASLPHQTSSISMIDAFLTHLTSDPDLHPEIRGYFLSEAQRNKHYRQGTPPPWREVKTQEARNAVATFLTGHPLPEKWEKDRSTPYIAQKDILLLADAFIDLFETGGQFFVSITPRGNGAWSFIPVTYADENACIISIHSKRQRMGIVLAQDWSG